jgi:hypothetical protein
LNLSKKSNIDHAIIEGLVNWMEFAMCSARDEFRDREEVLLNYHEETLNSDRNKMKWGEVKNDGPRNKPARQWDTGPTQ